MRAISPSNIIAQKYEQGATSVEYVVMLVAITVVIILTVALLGINTRDAFDRTVVAFTGPPADDDKCKGKDSDDDPDCGIGNDDRD